MVKPFVVFSNKTFLRFLLQVEKKRNKKYSKNYYKKEGILSLVYNNLQNIFLGKNLICSPVPIARGVSENEDFLIMGRGTLNLKAGCYKCAL